MQNTNLRTLVATIEGELAQIATYPAGAIPPTAIPELQVAWSRLVATLALGPEPRMRNCPSCNHVIMSAALRCGYCWSRLRPGASNEA